MRNIALLFSSKFKPIIGFIIYLLIIVYLLSRVYYLWVVYNQKLNKSYYL